MAALITTKYYLKRAFASPLQLALMAGLPAVIIFLNISVNMNIISTADGTPYFMGYNIDATMITMFVVLMFQAMSGVYAGEFVFHDFREANRWRLRAAPVGSSAFVIGALVASIIFSLVSAALVLVVMYFAFSIYLGNLGIVIATIFFLSLWAQFVGIIIAFFVKKKGSIDGLTIALSFAMSSLSGAFLITIPLPDFVQNFIIPTGVAVNAILSTNILTQAPDLTWRYGSSMADSLVAVGVLAGMAVLFGIIALVVARRRVS
ncbi:MAG: ABC transporter permease [Defluviitaleaceae bacterium]|nr:ABC transporter permease [Defluviitaleaceae bacterium]